MTRYMHCPIKPEGFKWEAHQRSRYSSCAWGFNTFAEALAYARQQYRNEVERTKARRLPGDEYCQQEFWATISGPGGQLGWQTIAPLVRQTGKEG